MRSSLSQATVPELIIYHLLIGGPCKLRSWDASRGWHSLYRLMPLMSRLIMSLLVLVALSLPAVAQYPNKPITVIVPFAAGGPTDVVTRLVCEHMSRIAKSGLCPLYL